MKNSKILNTLRNLTLRDAANKLAVTFDAYALGIKQDTPLHALMGTLNEFYEVSKTQNKAWKTIRLTQAAFSSAALIRKLILLDNASKIEGDQEKATPLAWFQFKYCHSHWQNYLEDNNSPDHIDNIKTFKNTPFYNQRTDYTAVVTNLKKIIVDILLKNFVPSSTITINEDWLNLDLAKMTAEANGEVFDEYIYETNRKINQKKAEFEAVGSSVILSNSSTKSEHEAYFYEIGERKLKVMMVGWIKTYENIDPESHKNIQIPEVYIESGTRTLEDIFCNSSITEYNINKNYFFEIISNTFWKNYPTGCTLLRTGNHLTPFQVDLRPNIVIDDPTYDFGARLQSRISLFWHQNKRRQILLYGIPGTGKSTFARNICYTLVKDHTPRLFSFEMMPEGSSGIEEFLSTFYPDIVIMDDIDRDKGTAKRMLNILESLNKRGPKLLIASVNDVDQLDPALKRPGRFDEIHEMKSPQAPFRKALIEGFLKDSSLKEYSTFITEHTENFTPAEIFELAQSLLALSSQSNQQEFSVILFAEIQRLKIQRGFYSEQIFD